VRNGTPAARDAVRIVATSSSDRKGDVYAFHTEKAMRPVAIDVDMGPAAGTSKGRIFLTPRAATPDQVPGPMIVDYTGRLIWFKPIKSVVAQNLTAQRYRGKPVLTWGERPPVTKPSEIFALDPKTTYFEVYDQSYNELGRLRAKGDGVGTDMHEFVITPRNTALLAGYKTVTRDASGVGGPQRAPVVDGIVQEIDLKTGKVLLDWSALEHLPLTDSMFPYTPGEPWDAYHVNSIAVAPDGNLIVSMRHTSAVYKIDRRTGKIVWTLGGKRSDFDMGKGTRFLFQHDAQPVPGGKLLLFDNRATDKNRVGPYSRVVELRVDERAKRATLVRQWVHDHAILAVSQGNARLLPNGNLFVGWGNRQWFSEYTPEGQQLFDGALPSVAYQTYRALKGPWSSRPKTKPAVVADRRNGRTLVWVSQNGATDVASWRVLGGDGKPPLRPLGSAPWENFETRLDVAATPAVIRVQGLDRSGKVLATSEPVRITR
jgi:hypothetical protein